MAYAIQSNIPVPKAPRRGSKKGSMYPFADMQIGQCFTVPVAGIGDDAKRVVSRLQRAAYGYRRKHNVTDKAFVVRVVLDSTDSPLLTSEGHVQVGVFAVSAE